MWMLAFWMTLALHQTALPGPDLSVLNECHRAARARDWKIGGDFEVRLTLSETGRVEGTSILKNTSGDAVLERCVRYYMQNLAFPGHKSPLTLRFSFPRNLPQAGVLAADVPVSRAAGNGVAARVLVHPGSVAGAGVSLSVVRVEKNGRIPLHLHQSTGISYFVLEGTGRLDVSPSLGRVAARPLSAGAAGYVPPGIPHEFIGPSGEEPLVFLLWSNPAGMEAFFVQGEPSRRDVLFFPPEKSSDPVPKAQGDAGLLRHADLALPSAEPRKTEKKTWFSVPSAGEWCVIAAPGRRSVAISPPRNGFFSAFVLRGGGEWSANGETHILQPGSGWFFRHKAVYTPKVENAPFFAIAYCSGGPCSVQ